MSQLSVLPPLNESPQEVVSDVCLLSQFNQITIECRMVVC